MFLLCEHSNAQWITLARKGRRKQTTNFLSLQSGLSIQVLELCQIKDLVWTPKIVAFLLTGLSELGHSLSSPFKGGCSRVRVQKGSGHSLTMPSSALERAEHPTGHVSKSSIVSFFEDPPKKNKHARLYFCSPLNPPQKVFPKKRQPHLGTFRYWFPFGFP